jgi:hypothetical protein
VKLQLKPPGTKRLKLKCDTLLYNSALKFNLRHFREVAGIDYSKAFIQAAKLMKDRGKLQYTAVRESDITARYEARAYTPPLFGST